MNMHTGTLEKKCSGMHQKCSGMHQKCSGKHQKCSGMHKSVPVQLRKVFRYAKKCSGTVEKSVPVCIKVFR
ncbi:hypothetical protein QL285_012445 [Trifolium repens]|nr:hypothetical protein QL285_012445 [Trifolium repens]